MTRELIPWDRVRGIVDVYGSTHDMLVCWTSACASAWALLLLRRGHCILQRRLLLWCTC